MFLPTRFPLPRYALSIAIAALFLACQPRVSASGLISNPGFDADTSGVASGWNVNASVAPGKTAWLPLSTKSVEGEVGDVSIGLGDGSHNMNGKHCLRLQGDMRSGKDFGLVTAGLIRVEPGFTYMVSAWYKAKGLSPENGDRSQTAHAYIDVFQYDAEKKYVASTRADTTVNTPTWTTLATQPITIPANVRYVAVRLYAVSSVPGRPFEVCYDDVSLNPQDASLPNSGFDELDSNGNPVGWKAQGTGKELVDLFVHHGGKSSVSVSDTANGPMSGWTTRMPARDDRAYRFGGWAKGGALAANGPLPGGALQIEFLDRDDRVLGPAIVSAAVGANQDWTELITPAVKTPVGTVCIRLTVGTQFCNGTAWFDDLRLDTQATASTAGAALITREPKLDPACHYSLNLLQNGDVEEGDGGKPRHWTLVGSSLQDWSDAAIETFHREGRPHFDVGRASGGWNHDTVYSGRESLLLESIDPPLSKNRQWYGASPVAGYWLSDAMPCSPGESYMAAAWICPGEAITEPWYGPLELQFFDASGKRVGFDAPRSALGGAPAAVWTWWTTWPYKAPPGATTMRLRVGQELSAAHGGWGRSFYDNLAVWHLASVPAHPEIIGNTVVHRDWLMKVLANNPAPYLPAPASAPEYETCVAKVENAVTGNCFRDPKSPVNLRISIANLLGEARTVTVHVQCFDWKGNELSVTDLNGIALRGYGVTETTLNVPATHAYGAFYVDLSIKEGKATAGSGSGRFAELPALDRPRTHEPIWGITPLFDIHGDNRPEEKEIGDLFHIAGFGISWVRLYVQNIDPDVIAAQCAKFRPILSWYRSLGIRPVFQIMMPIKRPFDREAYVRAGATIAKNTSDLVVAYGDHGIEISNANSPWRGETGSMSDEEYDLIMSALYKGLKSVAPATPVLVGNIATDWEGKTLTRLYGPPVNGDFDGAILNAYLGVTMTVVNSVKTLDAHGDTKKGVWQEETAMQASPGFGDARRYGEGAGASNLVRGWLEPVLKCGDRLKSFTMWGFCSGAEDNGGNIMMMNPSLQPRPQFVAHAVMADALADATLVADRSTGRLTCGEWKRGDGSLFVMWSNGGDLPVSLEVPSGTLTVMDVMGNRRQIAAREGVCSVTVGYDPVYCFGGGNLAFSKQLEVSLGHGDRIAGKPCVRVTLRSNQSVPIKVKLTVNGPVDGGISSDVTVKPHEVEWVDVPVTADALDSGGRTPFAALATLPSGAGFAAAASLNFAYAVHAKAIVALNGRWEGEWSKATVIEFGRKPSEVVPPNVPGESYGGPDSILGKLRLLWDEKYLYLGVEALDAVYCPVPHRGLNGFMGDSIEFAIQPDAILSNLAARYEYEFFRPGDDIVPALNCRFPSAHAGAVTGWPMAVVPTGHRGDVNYQLAIPWSDLGVLSAPQVGKVITMGVVLNNANKNPTSGARGRLRWFQGVDNKVTEQFGDVILVEPADATSR